MPSLGNDGYTIKFNLKTRKLRTQARTFSVFSSAMCCRLLWYSAKAAASGAGTAAATSAGKSGSTFLRLVSGADGNTAELANAAFGVLKGAEDDDHANSGSAEARAGAGSVVAEGAGAGAALF